MEKITSTGGPAMKDELSFLIGIAVKNLLGIEL
jgi:hypothetical protein